MVPRHRPQVAPAPQARPTALVEPAPPAIASVTAELVTALHMQTYKAVSHDELANCPDYTWVPVRHTGAVTPAAPHLRRGRA